MQQMYSAIDDSVDPLALKFCKEAESLWETAQNEGNDSINHIAAAELLSLGYLGHGRDHSVLKYSTEAARMGARMGLFGVIDQSQSAHKDDTSDTVEMQRPRSYAAWGVFNWLTFVYSLYFSMHLLTSAKAYVTILPSTGRHLPFFATSTDGSYSRRQW